MQEFTWRLSTITSLMSISDNLLIIQMILYLSFILPCNGIPLQPEVDKQARQKRSVYYVPTFLFECECQVSLIVNLTAKMSLNGSVSIYVVLNTKAGFSFSGAVLYLVYGCVLHLRGLC